MSIEPKRILSIINKEQPYSQTANILLDNSDCALTDLDFKGHKVVLNWGLKTKAGNEGKNVAPLWVISQQLNSSPGKLDCTLEVIGIFNLMAQDKASEKYIPDEDDTKTVKTLIDEILAATLACYSHCQAYEVVWEDGYDSLADTYKPKDTFRIYVGGSRQASFRRAIDYTGNVARVEADGKIHILKPTTTGSVYDYEYSLESGHTFFSKAYRKRVVIPGYIVVKSQPDDDPQYSGYAKDPGYDDLPAELKKREFKQMRLESDNQADDIAEAILSKYQLWAEMGTAEVPMNVDAEVFDYVKVTDKREGDHRVGNIGSLTRIYKPGEYSLRFSFGGWLTVRKVLEGLGITSDELEGYFTRLMVKDLYAENIMAENIDMVWLDPDNTIDLSKIGDTLDGLPDGEIYARVKTLHMDAGIIKLDENILYKAGYDPTGESLEEAPYRRALSAALTAAGLVILDEVVVGTYGLVKDTYISAGRILLSETEADDEWYNESGVEIDARHGINIYGEDQAFTTRRTKTGTIQCKVDSYGRIVAGAGKVTLDANGITIENQELRFRDTGGNLSVYMGYYSGAVFGIDLPYNDYFWLDIPGTASYIILESAFLTLDASDTIFLEALLEQEVTDVNVLYDIVPNDDNTWLGRSTNKYAKGYFTDLPACPVPTSNSALDIIKKIKAPKVTDGKYGRRHYFKDEDFPDEMKVDLVDKVVTKAVYERRQVTRPDGRVVEKKFKVSPSKVDLLPTGEMEIEFIRTIGVLVQAQREIIERLEALEVK